jgi:carbon-monoxide dehydrogenase medium subunit
MKPAPFEYLAVKTIDEAVDALVAHPDAKLIAGGQSLVPMMNFRLVKPTLLVDINHIDALKGIREEKGKIIIGAMTRHVELERSSLLADQVPLIAEAVSLVGHTAIRNRGTIGGSVSHADPAADLPVALMALEAIMHVQGPRGAHVIPVDQFFVSLFTTALESDEVLQCIELPRREAGSGWAAEKFSRRQGDFAIASVAMSLKLDPDGIVESSRIALGGVGNHAVRARRAESVVHGVAPLAAVLDECAAEAAREIDPPSDIHGSGEYRKSVVRALMKSALTRAIERAKHDSGLIDNGMGC